MPRLQNKKKNFTVIVAFLFILTGTYNAVVINSDSTISSDDVKFVKRLDELYGVVKPGRMLAASTTWKKLNKGEIKAKPIVQVVKRMDAAPALEKSETVVTAAVQEELELNLIEVINPNMWKQGLQVSEFSGNLSTNNGIINNLIVHLPNDEGLSVSYSEMSGNVFEYDIRGELYSGMIYQVDQNSYMVTLSNGPLEGTRLRFSKGSAEQNQQDTKQELAQNYQIETGDFGLEQSHVYAIEEITQYDQDMQSKALQAQGFNMEQQTF
jgi:hypothetical protein